MTLQQTDRKVSILYARVSTPESSRRRLAEGDRERQDPEVQLIKLRQFASSRGWIIEGEYTERLSGKDANRPVLDKIMSKAFKREFDVLLIVRLDRIMRSISNFVEVHDRLVGYGVDLVCTDQLIDTTTPAGRLQQNLLVAFAEYEREMIRERVKDGIAKARAEGKHLGRPRLPEDKLSPSSIRSRQCRERKQMLHKGGDASLNINRS